MQTSQSQIALIFLSLLAGATGCSPGPQSFERAIAQARETSLTLAPEVGSGAPFFAPGTLTPIWPTNPAQSVVQIPQFHLTNQRGQAIDQSIFDRDITVVGFIFTTCAGFCPTLVKKLKEIERGSARKPRFVLFTVDPEIDTPAQLRKFARAHGIDHARWTLLTGSKDRIYSLARDTFASEVRRIEASDMRRFAHTEHFYVIDENRRLRGVLNGTRIDLPKQAGRLVRELARPDFTEKNESACLPSPQASRRSKSCEHRRAS